MSTVTDNDLRELKDLINSKFEQVDRKIEQVNEKIDSRFEQVNSQFIQVNEKLNDMRVEIATVKSDVNGLGKRLDNLDFIARSVIGGIIIALLAGLSKILYPNLLN
ncbi:MAG: hypothetical protein GW795_08875 [Cyanobacteria bacterium]|nr:hypothetical protein [Cyanobacteria bacterium CG_2015-16_32_12]NCO77886.1 hypothetical protein [Cyanobacteria bacterium CG_2015-22_32_23]NCQ03051.1 hypothetical protein [Cyanobacteria bacterium CG_2015-09_32_10]NCQ41984.1 hypothetical protein [Cyanobacteria bacterium CG_2015-04_32_10]NCS84012.1 hypothetical protein [Cyanobacteria bacterium CG_2015-02_32_10]